MCEAVLELRKATQRPACQVSTAGCWREAVSSLSFGQWGCVPTIFKPPPAPPVGCLHVLSLGKGGLYFQSAPFEQVPLWHMSSCGICDSSNVKNGKEAPRQQSGLTYVMCSNVKPVGGIAMSLMSHCGPSDTPAKMIAYSKAWWKRTCLGGGTESDPSSF